MQYQQPLHEGRLLRRYKRFLADVVLSGGEQVVAHCPNTGRMTGCAEVGSRVWLRFSNDPKRKLAYSWELVETPAGQLVGIYSARANQLLAEALAGGQVAELEGYADIKPEVKVGDSRIDFCLSSALEKCFVEVKSATLLTEGGLGLFPDAVSSRGQKHLAELMELRAAGHRAVLFFCAQHEGIERLAPADTIDPVYGDLLRLALEAGVEILAYGCQLSPMGIQLDKRLPFHSSEELAR
jgi:sugar fermentation stimulation protein A